MKKHLPLWLKIFKRITIFVIESFRKREQKTLQFFLVNFFLFEPPLISLWQICNLSNEIFRDFQSDITMCATFSLKIKANCRVTLTLCPLKALRKFPQPILSNNWEISGLISKSSAPSGSNLQSRSISEMSGFSFTEGTYRVVKMEGMGKQDSFGIMKDPIQLTQNSKLVFRTNMLAAKGRFMNETTD